MSSSGDDIESVRRAELRRGKKDQQRDDDLAKHHAQAKQDFRKLLREMSLDQFKAFLINGLGLQPETEGYKSYLKLWRDYRQTRQSKK